MSSRRSVLGTAALTVALAGCAAEEGPAPAEPAPSVGGVHPAVSRRRDRRGLRGQRRDHDRQAECDCQFLAPVGGSKVAWLDGPDNRPVALDLAAESPVPRRTGITVPTMDVPGEEQVPNLLAGTDGTVVAAYPPESLGGDLRPAYLVPLDGERRPLAPDRRIPSRRPSSAPTAPRWR